MQWRQATQADRDGTGDHRYLVDIMPGDIAHQATNDGDALIRIGKRGWYWMIIDTQAPPRKKGEPYWLMMEEADAREDAIGAALEALAKLRTAK